MPHACIAPAAQYHQLFPDCQEQDLIINPYVSWVWYFQSFDEISWLHSV